MADFNITLAETYFRQKINANHTDADYKGHLEEALIPAKQRFKGTTNGVGPKNFANFSNTKLDIDIISSEPKTDTTHSFTYSNNLTVITTSDCIIIEGTVREILSSTNTSTIGVGEIVVNGTYSGSATDFRLCSMDSMNSMFAWLVVYFFTFTAYDLIIGEILAESQQFDEGSIISAQNELNRYREELLANASSDKQTVSELSPIPPSFTTNIPIRI